MQTLLFDVGEGVRDRILASDIISLNVNLAKYREDIKAGRARKNRNRSSELNGKNDNGSPKSRVAGRRFAIDKVKQSENVSPSEWNLRQACNSWKIWYEE